MIKLFKKYIAVWWIFSRNSIQTQLVVRWSVALFLMAKLLRFFVFVFFIFILLGSTKTLAGYNFDQTLFFFLTFSLIDSLVQALFREVYRFRPAILTGTFDFYLLKPFNALFRSLVAGPDIIDIFLVIPLIIAILYFLNRLNITDPFNIFLYWVFVIIGVIIATAFHIFVLALAILTTEIDHAILVYRDITGMGRFPVDIYKEPIRGLLTFVLPVGIMITFPVKALIGTLSPIFIFYSLIFTALLFFLSIKAWDFALKRYSSAGG